MQAKMDQTLQIPARMRIDNAANIYPASLSKHYASLYRMSVTLTEPVDLTVLQQALLSVSERIPTFRCELRAGAFWWHLRRMDKDPEVAPAAPLNRFHFSDNGGFLYKVSADGNRIVLDVFHALADGTGSETFLLTLAGEYLRLKYGLGISYSGPVLDPSEAPDTGEVEDSFKSVFSGRKGELEKNVPAYHIKGNRLPGSGLRDIRAVLSMDAVKANLLLLVVGLLVDVLLDLVDRICYRPIAALFLEPLQTRKQSIDDEALLILYGSDILILLLLALHPCDDFVDKTANCKNGSQHSGCLNYEVCINIHYPSSFF